MNQRNACLSVIGLPVTFPSLIYPIIDGTLGCAASAPIGCRAIDSFHRCAPSGSAPCIARRADSVCTAYTAFQRLPSCLSNNLHRLRTVRGNPKTLGSICPWNPQIRHPSAVRGISHEFPSIPRNEMPRHREIEFINKRIFDACKLCRGGIGMWAIMNYGFCRFVWIIAVVWHPHLCWYNVIYCG